ncbi:type III PLP-dependent enzyme domain-containing protein [Urechidicola croceus]|uniref:hypothetical protein n=1 Tax=Urechidicola croceus TaxID=1850246 RepID=UPI0009F584CB|nr:hypothetical protein [Urechidicola croceus]
MNRTGIKPEFAFDLHQQLNPKLFNFKGLHIYDGHIHTQTFVEIKNTVENYFTSINELIETIKQVTTKDFELICGGSITFPIHAQFPNRNLSPGTTLLWDYGYITKFPDLNFNIAGVILTRVISKPSKNIICIDLGHKAIASEMPEIPIYFPQIPNAKKLGHSEEHLTLEISNINKFEIGDILYGFPWHICPTVALHEHVGVIIKNKLSGFWEITARKRLYK